MESGATRVSRLYMSHFGVIPSVIPLAASGSGRQYFRLNAPEMPVVIGTAGIDRAENEDFLNLQGAMQADGINVPSVYAVSADRLDYLQEDLGDTSLFSMLHKPCMESLVEDALKTLPHLQTGLRTVGTAQLLRPAFDKRQALWDLNYFKYCFLKPLEIVIDEGILEDDFLRMTEDLTDCDPALWGFMYRDCQSRNIMIHDNRIYWIDFQGGRPGPITYDVASLLWQARARFSNDFRKRMVNIYSREVSALRDISVDEVTEGVYKIVPLRVMQTLGAYGFRGLTQRKEHFLKSIPAGIESLKDLAEQGVLDKYSEIKRISQKLWNTNITLN